MTSIRDLKNKKLHLAYTHLQILIFDYQNVRDVLPVGHSDIYN